MKENIALNTILESNPFLLKDSQDSSKYIVFTNLAECYAEMIGRLFDSSRRGYLDLALFLYLNYKSSKQWCESQCKIFNNSGVRMGFSDGVVMLNWNDPEGISSQIESILLGFCTILGSTFDRSSFLHGMTLFKLKRGFV